MSDEIDINPDALFIQLQLHALSNRCRTVFPSECPYYEGRGSAFEAMTQIRGELESYARALELLIDETRAFLSNASSQFAQADALLSDTIADGGERR